MRCPSCGDEYRDGVRRCADCGVELLPPGAAPPPVADALLGTFHPAVAAHLASLLAHRGIVHATEPLDGAVRVLVERANRDDLRAELLVSWPALVTRVDAGPDGPPMPTQGRLPGWHDPPESTWVDRAGRVQVGGDPEEEERAEARRVVGPSLVVVGAMLVLFGWYADAGAGTVVTGLALAALGAFLPR